MMTTYELVMIIKAETEQLTNAVGGVEQNNYHDPNRGYARNTIKKLRADLITLDKQLKEHKR